MRTIRIITLALVTTIAFASCNKKSPGDLTRKEVFKEVDTPPEFKGGQEALYVELGNALKYPEAAKERGEEGTVFVSFVITEEGKVTDVDIVKGLSEDLNKVALEAIKGLPDWKPGSNKGKNVPVQLTLPIKFMLPKE